MTPVRKSVGWVAVSVLSIVTVVTGIWLINATDWAHTSGQSVGITEFAYPVYSGATDAYPVPTTAEGDLVTTPDPTATFVSTAEYVRPEPYPGSIANLARPATAGRLVSGIAPTEIDSHLPFIEEWIGGFYSTGAWMCECDGQATLIWAGGLRRSGGDASPPDGGSLVIQTFDVVSRKPTTEPVITQVPGAFSALQIIDGGPERIVLLSDDGQYWAYDWRRSEVAPLSADAIGLIRASTGSINVPVVQPLTSLGVRVTSVADVEASDRTQYRIMAGSKHWADGPNPLDGHDVALVAIAPMETVAHGEDGFKIKYAQIPLVGDLRIHDIRGDKIILRVDFFGNLAMFDLRLQTLEAFPEWPISLSGLFSPIWLEDVEKMTQLAVMTPFPTETFGTLATQTGAPNP